MIRNLEDHTKDKSAPCAALIRQPKVEFPQMTDCVLLILPPSPLPNCAQAALKTIVRLLYKAMVCQKRLETTGKVHAFDLRKLEQTNKGIQGDGIGEYCGDPLAREIGTTTPPARGLHLEGIRLVLSGWLLSRAIISFRVRPLPCADSPTLAGHQTA
jgi:hypothetical protein